MNRMPCGINNPMCELFLLNLDIENPIVQDLVRITASANGAEVTGATVVPEGNILLVNCTAS